MEDELGGQIMKEFVGLRAKTYSYLTDNYDEDKKARIERKMNYLRKKKIDVDSLKEDKKESIKNNKLILKAQQRFKSERHNVFTEEINKIALSSNDDKRM